MESTELLEFLLRLIDPFQLIDRLFFKGSP